MSEQGQITDRFGKAVEQLGSPEIEVRLGGIYALERLAHDSDRDEPTITEVLPAYVRDRSPATTECKPPADPIVSATPPGSPQFATDTKAALTVLVRRSPAAIQRTPADLTGACLAGANLDGAHLDGAHFSTATLVNTYLSRADLSAADLSGAHLSGAHLSATNLSDADLSDADFSAADARALLRAAGYSDDEDMAALLRAADLSGADLTAADLTGAKHDQNTRTDGAITTLAIGVWW